MPRITSYNVCYTKLLRRPKAEENIASSSGAAINDDFISMLTSELAAFIGPVAPIVIEDAIDQMGLSATQNQILVEVASVV